MAKHGAFEKLQIRSHANCPDFRLLIRFTCRYFQGIRPRYSKQFLIFRRINAWKKETWTISYWSKGAGIFACEKREEKFQPANTVDWSGEFRSCWGWSYKQVPLEHIFWLSFFASFSWTLWENFTFPRPLYFLPIQTGFSGSCAPESATNPIGHSHLYDPTVLLQTWLAPQASRDWHSSKSTKVKKQNWT